MTLENVGYSGTILLVLGYYYCSGITRTALITSMLKWSYVLTVEARDLDEYCREIPVISNHYPIMIFLSQDEYLPVSATGVPRCTAHENCHQYIRVNWKAQPDVLGWVCEIRKTIAVVLLCC